MGFALLALLSAATSHAQDWRYRVRPGDTVWDLSGKYLRGDVPWQRLQDYNRIADPYRLPPGTLMRLPVTWLKVQPAKATVVGVHGAALAVDSGGKESSVAQGMQLGIGTRLRTAPGGSLTLQFADGSRLLLQGDSELVLDKLSAYGATGMTDTRLRLPKGRTSNEVQPLRGAASRYIIRTPTLMSSVRGTRFRVGSDGDAAQVEVTEGHVQVDGAGRIWLPTFAAVLAAFSAVQIPASRRVRTHERVRAQKAREDAAAARERERAEKAQRKEPGYMPPPGYGPGTEVDTIADSIPPQHARQSPHP